MSISNLRVNPKDFKLNCSDEILKTMKPYFDVSSRCTSSMHMEKEVHGGQSKKTTGHEGKCIIDVRLRDSRSGELLGKGHVEYDEGANKPEKYDEKVELKDVFGNKIGEATLEVEQKKGQINSVEAEFRKMRHEVNHMMRETNKVFENFSRKHTGKDYGFGLLDEFRPMLMFNEPWMKEEMSSLGWGGDQGKIDVEQSKIGSTTGQQSVGSTTSGQSGTQSPSQQKLQSGEKMQVEGKHGTHQQGTQQQGVKSGGTNKKSMETEKPFKT